MDFGAILLVNLAHYTAGAPTASSKNFVLCLREKLLAIANIAKFFLHLLTRNGKTLSEIRAAISEGGKSVSVRRVTQRKIIPLQKGKS